MKGLLEKRWIQACLGIIVVVIWGFNMSKIAKISTESGQVKQAKAITLDEAFFDMPKSQTHDYNGNYRDPFKIQLRKKVKEKTVSDPELKTEKIRPPQLKLTGVIEGTALIQNSHEVIFFASVGDKIEGAIVKSVTQDSVVMEFKSKEFSVLL